MGHFVTTTVKFEAGGSSEWTVSTNQPLTTGWRTRNTGFKVGIPYLFAFELRIITTHEPEEPEGRNLEE